jgi:hypothetical protein
MQQSTKEHFQNLLTALQTEKKEDLDQFKMLSENADFSQRIEKGITLYPIEFISTKFNDFGDMLIDIKPKTRGIYFDKCCLFLIIEYQFC